MRAVMVDPDAVGRLALGEAEPPEPDPGQAIVRVQAISLNRGEVRYAQAKPAKSRIGWDVAGIVERAAADGTGPEKGTAAVAFVPAANAWAELAAVPTPYLAAIPEGVSPIDAAALPVAALTALYGLERGERLLGTRVLVTGASGGVGLYACQLAKLMGATVIAQIRNASHRAILEDLRIDEVVVDETGSALSNAGPFGLIFDGVGGSLLSHTLPRLATGGKAVLYGVTGSTSADLPIGPLLGSGDAAVQGFNLYHESRVAPAGLGLGRLLELVRSGRLKTFVERTGDWSDIGQTASDLLERRFHGKAVLRVS
jgi:NADPH:quinone reductase-like Zn-dependent oxidoreductase